MPYIRAAHNSKPHLKGLLAAMLPPGTHLLPNNRRTRTLGLGALYDRRARYLTGLGDDSDFGDISASDLSDLEYGGGDSYFGGSGTAILPTYSGGSAVAPDLPASAVSENPTGIIQSTGLPTYLPSSLMYPNSGPLSTGSTVLPSGQVVGPTAGAAGSAATAVTGLVKSATGTSTILPSGQVVATAPIAGTGLTASQWLASSTLISGYQNQSVLIGVVAGGLLLNVLMKKKKKR